MGNSSSEPQPKPQQQPVYIPPTPSPLPPPKYIKQINPYIINFTNDSEIDNIAFRLFSNNMYVCAQSNGTKPLIGSKKNIQKQQTFDIIILDSKKRHVAIKSHTNGMYVCAQNLGKNPLMANRTYIKKQQTFQIKKQTQGYSIKSLANGMYVCAQVTQGKVLIANKKDLNDWTRFQLMQITQILQTEHLRKKQSLRIQQEIIQIKSTFPIRIQDKKIQANYMPPRIITVPTLPPPLPRIYYNQYEYIIDKISYNDKFPYPVIKAWQKPEPQIFIPEQKFTYQSYQTEIKPQIIKKNVPQIKHDIAKNVKQQINKKVQPAPVVQKKNTKKSSSPAVKAKKNTPTVAVKKNPQKSKNNTKSATSKKQKLEVKKETKATKARSKSKSVNSLYLQEDLDKFEQDCQNTLKLLQRRMNKDVYQNLRYDEYSQDDSEDDDDIDDQSDDDQLDDVLSDDDQSEQQEQQQQQQYDDIQYARMQQGIRGKKRYSR